MNDPELTATAVVCSGEYVGLVPACHLDVGGVINDTQRIEQLEREVRDLAAFVSRICKNTNAALTGHAAILESLVDHTKYVPAAGKRLRFPRTPVDVGSV